jgi:diaminopimelate epimerase
VLFTKMEGLGNDYVYVNCFKEKVENPAELARYISDRHTGIGSDGLILIGRSDIADFFMDIYNADGSRAQMCGNGIRCVGKYVYDKKMTDEESITVETLAGVRKLKCDIESGRVTKVTVDMGSPGFCSEAEVISLTDGSGEADSDDFAGKHREADGGDYAGKHIEADGDDDAGRHRETDGDDFAYKCRVTDNIDVEWVQVGHYEERHLEENCLIERKSERSLDTQIELVRKVRMVIDDTELIVNCLSVGNPHGVVYTENIEEAVTAFGPLIERHPMFPQGINVEFVRIINKNLIEMRVWERGSGETMACGTGACACVVASVLKKLTDSKVTVRLPGGELDINYDMEENTIYMTGPARTVFEGTLSDTGGENV